MNTMIMVFIVVITFISSYTSAHAWVKPVNARNYDMTYPGYIGTGDFPFATLYCDNENYGANCGGCQGEMTGAHPGIDISCPTGTTVRSIYPGQVVISYNYGAHTSWGECIVIRHTLPSGEVIYSCYAHLSRRDVFVTNDVTEGQTIGLSGNTGRSDGPHLHFQIDRHFILGTTNQVGVHPYWYGDVNADDADHEIEKRTINPLAFIQTGASAPVGFLTNYNGVYWWDEEVSQDFRDKYNSFVLNGGNVPDPSKTTIGFPWDNGFGDQWVHQQNDMYIQDFFGPDNIYYNPYTALIRKTGANQEVYLLKEGFWTYWMGDGTRHGWIKYGAPTSDEYNFNSYSRQDFSKNQDQEYYFLWQGNRTRVYRVGSNQEVTESSVTVEHSSLTLTEGDGVYYSGVKVADFNQPFTLVNGDSYSGFSARIGNNTQTISQFTVNGDMTIHVGGGLASQVTQLYANPAVPCPGAPFNVAVSVSASPGVVVDWLRVALMWPSDPSPANIIYSEANRNMSPGFSGTFSTQYFTPGNYQIAVQYSMDDGNTWNYFGTYPNVQNPLPIVVLAGPMVSFGYSPSSGQAPLVVQFFDQTSGYYDYMRWEFGDGQISNSPNPVHVYNTPGTYSVSLIATNSCGSDVESCWYCVVVSEQGEGPEAAFTADVTSGQVPLRVQFTDLSTGSPDIYAWYWDFGDGNTSTFPSPAHVYNSPGVYDVSLLVSNSMRSDYISIPDYITVNYPDLDPGFVVDTTLGVDPLIVQFTDTTIGNPTSWLWEFGDGQNSADRHPAHIFDTPGVYTVTLQVTDAYRSLSEVKTDYIRVIQEINADFSADTVSGFGPLTVRFTDQSSGNIENWHWDFGDGGISSLQNPQHTYYMPGQYDVVLIVSDGYQTDTLISEDFVSVIVRPSLLADFSTNVTSGFAPLAVQFTDQSTGNPTSWEWQFWEGDQVSYSYEQNPQFIYEHSGFYTVVLRIENGIATRTIVRSDYIVVDSDCNDNEFSDLAEMQIVYPPANVVNVEPGISSFVFPVDLDNDGDMDVVSAGWSDGNIIWQENLGDQSFVSHQIGFQDRARFVYAVDLDNDSDMDVLTHATGSGAGIYWYENSDFVFSVHSVGSQSVPDIYPVDLDQDGDMDILAPFGDVSTGVCWYVNQGNGIFVEQLIGARMAKSTYPYDIDVDGDLDVLAIGPEGIYLYENSGVQNFSEIFITDMGGAGNYIRVIDVIGYGDDYFDIVFPLPEFGQIRWIENHGSNVFDDQDILVDGVGLSHYIGPADTDGDGDMDFFSADIYGNQVSLFENLGPAEGFAEHLLDTLAYEAACVSPADMDGDGDLDVVAATKGMSSIHWYEMAITDRNHNNVLDECEIADGSLTDCNLNNIPDFAEVNMGTATDTDNNNVLDECETLIGEMEVTILYTGGSLVLDWNDVNNANRYLVYSSVDGSFYSVIDTVTVSNYTLAQSLFDANSMLLFQVIASR